MAGIARVTAAHTTGINYSAMYSPHTWPHVIFGIQCGFYVLGEMIRKFVYHFSKWSREPAKLIRFIFIGKFVNLSLIITRFYSIVNKKKKNQYISVFRILNSSEIKSNENIGSEEFAGKYFMTYSINITIVNIYNKLWLEPWCQVLSK